MWLTALWWSLEGDREGKEERNNKREVRGRENRYKKKVREKRGAKKAWARTGIEASLSVLCVFGHMQRRSEVVLDWMAVNGLITPNLQRPFRTCLDWFSMNNILN